MSKITFIQPFFYPVSSQIKGVSAGIGFLRGFLKNRGFDSAVIDLNDLILELHKKDRRLVLDFTRRLKKELSQESLPKGFKNDIEEMVAIQNAFIESRRDRIWILAKKIDLFEPIFKRSLKISSKTELVGFSITSRLQLFFSLVLAQYIKIKFKTGIKIVFGGSFLTMKYPELIPLLEENPIIDYLIINEGETSLYSLLKKDRLSDVPNLIYLESGRYKRSNNLRFFERVSGFPSPIFGPDDTFYLWATRKCYWSRCTFCILKNNSVSSRLLIRRPEEVCRDAKVMEDSLKGKEAFYCFTDATLPPSFLRDFSKLVIKDKSISRNFMTYLKFDKQVDGGLLRMAKEAGFGRTERSQIKVGIETFNPRLSRLLNKGTDKKHELKMINSAAQDGVWLELHLMIGLPTQTEKELLQDLEHMYFFRKKYKNINVTVFPFRLVPDTEIYRQPKRYGIRLAENGGLFLEEKIQFKPLDKNHLTTKRAVDVFVEWNKGRDHGAKGKMVTSYEKMLSGDVGVLSKMLAGRKKD